MMKTKKMEDIIDVLNEIKDDNTVPKNVKERIIKIKEVLTVDIKTEELSLCINKSLDILDEIVDDSNLQPYTRTQLWSISSLLEAM